jgi:hypothetical protein
MKYKEENILNHSALHDNLKVCTSIFKSLENNIS